MAAKRPPVLLVHGILGQQHLYWNLFRHRLGEDGFAVHEFRAPRYMFGDLRLASRELAKDIDTVLAKEGAAHLDLVCHSVGGLVARHYLQSRASRGKVGHLVMLGTPHRGTQLAALLSVAAPVARQASPGSAVLSELERRGIPGGVRVTNFWSPVDGIIVPGRNSRFEQEGVRNVKVMSHHWGYLFSRGIYTKVRNALLDQK
ncbi:MAG: alpha/beta fold hydrolase [bacterium]